MLTVKSCEIGAVPFLSGNIAKLVLTSDAKASGPKHWTLKWDVSGSMNWALNQVKRDLNGFVAMLPESDYVSIVIFSGHNEARVIVSPTLCDKSGKKLISSRIDAVRILSTTVFSEPLELALKTVKNMSTVAGLQHHSVLFTDGHEVPTNWSSAEERRKSIGFATVLGTAGVSLSTIGYGYYYNAPFLSDMVIANGATGVRRHINDITNFATVVNDIRGTVQATTPVKANLSVNVQGGKVGVVLRTTPEVQKVGSGGTIAFQSVVDGEITLFIALSAGSREFVLSGTVDGAKFGQVVKGKPLSAESVTEAALAAASWAFQNDEVERASDLLQQSGNTALATMVGNANTQRERLTLGDEMRRILVDNNVRHRYATKTFIGAGKTACVVNLLRLLLEEDCTVFFPRDKEFVKTTVTTHEEGMRHKPNAKFKMTGIQSNKSRYNISMKAVVDVEEKDLATGKWKDATRNRTYVFVLDGNLHQETLEAYLTQKVFDTFQEWGVIPSSARFSEKTLYTLDLTSLPMIVNSWANPKQLGMVDLMKEELLLKATQTAINSRIKELRAATGKGSSGPKRTKEPANDSYFALHYEYQLKGFVVPKNIDFSAITDLAAAEEKAKQIRKRLMNIRCIIRLVQFALDMTGNKLFANVPPTLINRSDNVHGKVEQIISLDSLGEPSLTLRRITWTQAMPITASPIGMEDDEDEQIAA